MTRRSIRTMATFRINTEALEASARLGVVSPRRTVPPHIPRPDYSLLSSGQPSIKSRQIHLLSKAEIDQMKRACQIASYIREYAGKQVSVGITTDEIDRRVHEEVIRLGVYPSPLGYNGFPKSICTSINNVVCHGIPDNRVLEDGDIINIDVSVYADGYHGDCSGMFVAGNASEEDYRLINATKEAMDAAINICQPGRPIADIGEIIQSMAERDGFYCIAEFTGHGIGREFHMAPSIFHVRNGYPGKMEKGMVFTIEPIFTGPPPLSFTTTNEKSNSSDENQTVEPSPSSSSSPSRRATQFPLGRATYQCRDNWTIVSLDGAKSAQWEQTIAITENGAEILTQHQPGQFER